MVSRARASKSKGRGGQNEVVKIILDTFPHLHPDDVRSATMGMNGEDIQLSPTARKSLPISVEVKRNKSFATIYKYYEQAKDNSNTHEPVVCIRGDREKWLTIVDTQHYFNLLKKLEEK